MKSTYAAWIGLAAIGVVVAAGAGGCDSKKPNANDDVKTHEKSLMEKMDKIAAEEEKRAAEEKAAAEGKGAVKEGAEKGGAAEEAPAAGAGGGGAPK
ncbi:MAG: hypothetical protein KF745_05480 [Phycisphaeraceae bacterium]|nr:hypothetical protein [Phycisphaeraceae bacterium]